MIASSAWRYPEWIWYPQTSPRDTGQCVVLWTFFSLSLSFPPPSSIHYTVKFSMMMHVLNMVGTYLVNPFYIKIPHECQASSFSSNEFEPQQEAERNSTNLPHEPFQVWAGRKLLQQIFKRTVLVHYLHANERPIPLSLSEHHCSGQWNQSRELFCKFFGVSSKKCSNLLRWLSVKTLIIFAAHRMASRHERVTACQVSWE